jgi:DNA-binding NarL/FixJ family response regulator
MATYAPQSDSGAMDEQRIPTVLLVDDSAPVRERLKELLAQAAPVRIVGEADTAASAITAIAAKRPDFVVLDYKLPDGTGLEVLRAVAAKAPESVFIVLTNHATAHVRAACTGAGARYFLDKSSEFGQLANIIADLDALHA